MRNEFDTHDLPTLPFELLRLEDLLSRLHPQACHIDRDELMYRCGWAAAMAQRRSRSRDTAKRQAADDC